MSKNEIKLVEYDIVSHSFIKENNRIISTGYFRNSNHSIGLGVKFFRLIAYLDNSATSFINWSTNSEKKIKGCGFGKDLFWGLFADGKYFEIDTTLHKVRWEVDK